MKLLYKYYLYRYKDKSNKNGFALPQILVLSIGIALGITGLLAASINRLTTTRLATLELQSKNAADSGVSAVRSLLNNSKGSALFYFWLTKTCAKNSQPNECYVPPLGKLTYEWPGQPVKGTFPDISTLYWTNDVNDWCAPYFINGVKSNKCLGRQVAPKCSALGTLNSIPIPWGSYRQALVGLIDDIDDPVGFALGGKRTHEQSFSLKAIDYIGNESGGTTTLLIEGFAKPVGNSNVESSTNKLAVKVGVSKVVPPSSFAVISAGENEADSESLYLGKFSVYAAKAGQRPIGSIIWRRNITRSSDCVKIPKLIGLKNKAGLPDNSKSEGGIWIQPLSIPPRPQVSKKKAPGQPAPWSMGPTFCTKASSKENSSNCKWLAEQTYPKYANQNRTATYDDIYVHGDEAVFKVISSDKSKVMMVVRGSIEIANGGKFCHMDKNSKVCGSGKPENLTILFDQPGQNALGSLGSSNGKQELSCSSNGGTKLKENKNVPHNTFILSNTGKSNKDKFSAFIYATDTTFTTAISPAPYYQRPVAGKRHIVRFRGVYGYVENPEGRDTERSPKLLKSPNGKMIPFTTKPQGKWDPYMNGLIPIAIGSKTGDPKQDSVDNMLLVYNSITKRYSLRGLFLPLAASEAKLLPKLNKGAFVDLGVSPLTTKAPSGTLWLTHYGIELDPQKNNKRYVNGMAWMKNVCFDDSNDINWEFNKDLQKDFVLSMGKIEYNYGVPFYRGQAVQVWDTLRDFQ